MEFETYKQVYNHKDIFLFVGYYNREKGTLGAHFYRVGKTKDGLPTFTSVEDRNCSIELDEWACTPVPTCWANRQYELVGEAFIDTNSVEWKEYQERCTRLRSANMLSNLSTMYGGECE